MRILATIAILLMAQRTPAGDWPQWLGPNRDGASNEIVKPWTDPPKVLWRVRVGEGHSSPVVAGGRVYLTSKVAGKDEEQLTVYDAATGKELDSTRHARKPFTSMFGVGPRATPVVTADGQAITLGVTGVLDMQGPPKPWNVDLLTTYKANNLRFGVSSSPLVVGDRVVAMVGGPGAGLVALNRKTGELVWKSLDDKASYAAPILLDHAGRKLVVALTADGVVAVDAASGETVWRHPFKDLMAESSTTPVRVGELLIASSVTLGAIALKLTTREGRPAVEQVWKNPRLTCYFSTPVVVGEHLFIVTGSLVGAMSGKPEAELHCVEAATGRILWTRPKVGKYHAALLRTGDNKLLFHSDSGDLSLLEPNGTEYRELCRTKACGFTWAHPALSDGRLFVRDDKELIALELPH